MKNIIFLVLSVFIALSFSCQNTIDDDMENDNDLSSEVDYMISDELLTLDHLKDFLPEEILQQKSIVFESSNGKEITLTTEMAERTSTNMFGEQQYEGESIFFSLRDEESLTQIILAGNAIYGFGKNSDIIKLESIDMRLMPSYTENNANTNGEIVLDEEGNFSSLNSSEIPQTVTLNGKTYEDTFQFVGDNPDRFSELFYKTDIGILGFRTFNNTLYVFKEYLN